MPCFVLSMKKLLSKFIVLAFSELLQSGHLRKMQKTKSDRQHLKEKNLKGEIPLPRRRASNIKRKT